MFYLLAVMINITNFKPVVSKDCIELSSDKARIEFEKVAADMKEAGFSCEKKVDALLYNCQNTKAGVIGKITLMKDKKECKSYPEKLASDLKTLVGK